MSDKTIKGLTKVLKDLEKFGSESKKEVEEITKISSMDIVADAKAFAPKNLGKLPFHWKKAIYQSPLKQILDTTLFY